MTKQATAVAWLCVLSIPSLWAEVNQDLSVDARCFCPLGTYFSSLVRALWFSFKELSLLHLYGSWAETWPAAAAAAAKSLQSCPTLCDPIDGCSPGSPIPGILQARILKRVAISFSDAWKWKVKVKPLSRAQLTATPWTAAYQAPPSIGFSRQEYWSGVPLPSPKALYSRYYLLPHFTDEESETQKVLVTWLRPYN